MRPVLQQNKIHYRFWFLYAAIFIICTAGIAISLYLQYYQEEKIGIVFGITGMDSEEQDEYNDLKAEFSTLFTNGIENLQNEIFEVQKINDDYDIVVTAYSYQKDTETCTLNAFIPYINIKDDTALKINTQIKENFKDKAERYQNEDNIENIVYTVEYKAYIQDNILSLVIKSELKEGTKSQKIIVNTYNYNFIEKKEVKLQEILNLKNINEDDANEKILNEIKTVQQQNEALAEQGYILYKRDYTSNMYKVENTKQYFLGKDGMLYLIYPYGNNDYTSETDIVIFK